MRGCLSLFNNSYWYKNFLPGSIRGILTYYIYVMGKELIVIGGPTASGKTGLAIRLAREWKTEIISADSRQVYREMNIGVSRPSKEELAAAPHHFIASHSVHDHLTAGDYEYEAIPLLNDLFRKHDKVIVCGGSGLFIKALCEGLDRLPTSASVKRQLKTELNDRGLPALQSEVLEKDPELYEEMDVQNPHRVMRALEIMRISGEKASVLRSGVKKARPFSVHYYGLDWDRNELYARINARADLMIRSGLELECQPLYLLRDLTALQTVGYVEIFDYFDGSIDLTTAIEHIKMNTRRYAKRQLTWFRNEVPTKWLPPEPEAAAAVIFGAHP
jgi:tRNA dimethylallyltransferase